MTALREQLATLIQMRESIPRAQALRTADLCITATAAWFMDLSRTAPFLPGLAARTAARILERQRR